MRGRRVIVAGAGLAGLTAAHELARTGASVTVVEGRHRAGGRVWTRREGMAAGQHAELGGEFIDDQHASMRRMAKQFGLALVPVLPGGFTHRYRTAHGQTLTRERPWRALRDVIAPLIEQYREAVAAPESAAVRRIAGWSVDEWLRHEEASPDLHAMATLLRGFFLADPGELSVLPLIEQLEKGGSPSRVRMFRISGGSGRLIDALIAGTPARVLFQHTLREVHQPGDGVVAHVSDASGRLHQIEADAAVIALPASTLRDVRMVPTLPEAQARAIGSLRYGCATKVVVQCAHRGLAGRRVQAFATDSPLGAFWDSTAGQTPAAPEHTGTHAVLAFLGGGCASARLRDRARAGAAHLLSDLCWLGLAGAPITAVHTATWEEDPMARGGYAFLDPAFDPAWRPLLSRRAGRLVFAGEHTSEDHQGYMEGAVQSGLRAARELLDAAPA